MIVNGAFEKKNATITINDDMNSILYFFLKLFAIMVFSLF